MLAQLEFITFLLADNGTSNRIQMRCHNVIRGSEIHPVSQSTYTGPKHFIVVFISYFIDIKREKGATIECLHT